MFADKKYLIAISIVKIVHCSITIYYQFAIYLLTFNKVLCFFLMFRLKMIASNEQVEVTDDAIQALINFSEGDMRKSITFLQVIKD